MIKTAMALALLVVGVSSAYAQESATIISDSFSQIRNEEAETRNKVNDHTKAIEALNKKYAENSATKAPVASVSNASTIDYTRYDTIVRDCRTAWVPQPERKDELAKRWNALTEDGFGQLDQKCMRLVQQAAARRHEQQAAVVPPPAPEGIQEGGAEVIQAHMPYGYGSPMPPAPYPAVYGRETYRYGHSYQYSRSYHRYGRSRVGCSPGFHYDPRERTCLKYTAVDVNGPSPYNVPDDQAHCTPGTHRSFVTQGPYGPRRVYQVCRTHH